MLGTCLYCECTVGCTVESNTYITIWCTVFVSVSSTTEVVEKTGGVRWRKISISEEVKDLLDNIKSLIINYVCGKPDTPCAKMIMRDISYNKLIEAMATVMMQNEEFKLTVISTALTYAAKSEYLTWRERIEMRLREIKETKTGSHVKSESVGPASRRFIDCTKEQNNPLCNPDNLDKLASI